MFKGIYIKTRPATSNKKGPQHSGEMNSKSFARKRFIKHIECPPIRDHKGNGKIERSIRVIIERLRTNKKIISQKDTSGLSEILFVIRMNPSVENKSPYKSHTAQEPNMIKRIATNATRFVSGTFRVQANW